MDRAAAFELLPEAYGHALRLRDAGSEPAEIARILRIAPEAVASALELAEAKLARLLTDSEGPANTPGERNVPPGTP